MDDCPQCGYRPRKGDAFEITMNEGASEYEYQITHVICYGCGMEWVE